MNKKNLISNIWTIILVLLGSALVFSACENEDLNTNPLTAKEVTLKAFGPNPALRGQKLSFAGTNLDKITKVILPNNIEVTDIEVINDKLIKVLVPQETVAGIIQLIGPNNLELSSQDSLTISEPIEITKMTPQPVKAGQTLTIEGNYFNLIEKVIFSDKVTIEGKDFIKWERTKIELTLPAEAQTGIVILANNDSIPLEYQSSEPLQIVLPSVNEVLDLTNKKPGEGIATTGKDLDLIVKVEMPNGAETPFTVENDALKFTLPDDVSDGAIVMIPASGVKVVVANIGVAMPANLTITPNKDLRSGDEITIKGINLELVTSIQFPGIAEAVKPASQSATEIKVNMPGKATSGELQLNTASGKTVPLAIATQKPDVVSYNPTSASAGSEITLQGHHLDLVASVTFRTVADSVVVEVVPSASDNLTLTVPLNAVSGVVVLTMANGETVESALEITPPPFCYIPNPPGPKAEIHAGGVLTLEVENGVQLTDVQINGASVKYILDASKLYIVIPSNAKGATELKLVSSNGNAVYTIPVIAAGIVETVVFEGPLLMTWSDGGQAKVPVSSFDGVFAGSILKIYFVQTDAWGQIQINNGKWTIISFEELGNDGYIKTDTYNDKSVTEQELILTQSILDDIINNAEYGNGLILQGQDFILSKISIITGSASSTEAIWEGEFVVDSSWSNWLNLEADKFANAQVGKTLVVNVKDVASGAQCGIRNSSWGSTDLIEYADITGNSFELPITQGVLDAMAGGLYIGGHDYTITKIEIK